MQEDEKISLPLLFLFLNKCFENDVMKKKMFEKEIATDYFLG